MIRPSDSGDQRKAETMRRFAATLPGAVSALALAASGVVAQQLGEVCPGAQPGTGACGAS